jgi:hypothetical protein
MFSHPGVPALHYPGLSDRLVPIYGHDRYHGFHGAHVGVACAALEAALLALPLLDDEDFAVSAPCSWSPNPECVTNCVRAIGAWRRTRSGLRCSRGAALGSVPMKGGMPTLRPSPPGPRWSAGWVISRPSSSKLKGPRRLGSSQLSAPLCQAPGGTGNERSRVASGGCAVSFSRQMDRDGCEAQGRNHLEPLGRPPRTRRQLQFCTLECSIPGAPRPGAAAPCTRTPVSSHRRTIANLPKSPMKFLSSRHLGRGHLDPAA